MFSTIKLWLYAILGSVLAVLGFASVHYRGKAERMKRERDTLKATVHAERTRKKIEKEKKEELSRRESKIKERMKKVETSQDLDDLFNDDNW